MSVDAEEEFWKEQLVHIMHKNMVRTNAERLYMADAKAEFEAFSLRNKSVPVNIQQTEGYVTCEIEVTPQIIFRLFIQSQIKFSIMKKGSDFVKLADAKFLYNPIPEIEEFLQNIDEKLEELQKKTEENLKFQKQQKITGEMIKALLMKKMGNSRVVWRVEAKEKDFVLIIEQNSDREEYPISMKNFVNDIKALEI